MKTLQIQTLGHLLEITGFSSLFFSKHFDYVIVSFTDVNDAIIAKSKLENDYVFSDKISFDENTHELKIYINDVSCLCVK